MIFTYVVIALAVAPVVPQSIYLWRFRHRVLLDNAAQLGFSQAQLHETEGVLAGLTSISVRKVLGTRLGKPVVVDVRDRANPVLLSDLGLERLPPVHGGDWHLLRRTGRTHVSVRLSDAAVLVIELNKKLRHQIPRDLLPSRRIGKSKVTL